MRINLTVLRLTAVAGLAVVAVAAQAFTLDVVSIGTYTNQASPGYDSNQTVVYQTSSAPAPVLTTTYFEIPVVTGAGETGDGTYSNGVDSFSFDAVVTDVQTVGSAQSFDATWVYTSGTGGYANKVANGTFSTTLNLSTGAAYTSLVGQFAAVPEPTSLAILAVGCVGLLKRRNRK